LRKRFQPLAVVVPPGVQFRLVGENGGARFVVMAANGQAFAFPTPNGAFVTPQVGGDLLPRIQPIARWWF